MKTTWYPKLFITGIVFVILGVLDPMEGSIVILMGSLLIAISSYLMQNKFWKLFTISFLLILVGVFFLFFFSSLGGIGGNSRLSMWWGMLILPYPLGWIMSIVLIIVNRIHQKKMN